MKIKKQIKRTNNKVMRNLKRKYNFKNAFRQFDNKFISPYGGYIDIMNFANLLGLQKNVRKNFNIQGIPHRKYNDFNLFQRLLDTVVLDIDRIDNADLFYNDPLLRYLEDLETDPSPSTLRRELKSCNTDNISAIENINTEFIKNCSSLQPKQSVTLLIDPTAINAYGEQEEAKKGYNHHESDRCYQAMVAAIKETQDVIKIDLKPGNFTPNGKDFKEFFAQVIAMIPEHLKVDKIRMDSGFFNFSTFNLLEDNNLIYFVKGKMQPNTEFFNKASSIPKKDWIKIKDKENFWVSKKQWYYSTSYKRSYPVIFTRQLIEDPDPKQQKLFKDHKVYQYYPIFSNSPWDELSIWRFYNSGASVETIIKELKNEFFIDKIPTSIFIANNAFIKIKTIAYNLINAFKRLVLGGNWTTKSAKAIRNWIIRVPVIVVSFGKGVKLSMAQNIKLQRFILGISDKVYAIATNLVN